MGEASQDIANTASEKHEETGVDDDASGDDTSDDDGAAASSRVLEASQDDATGVTEHTSTTLVEVTDGVCVVFGEVPDGMDLVDFGLIPAADREKLTEILGSAGTFAGAGGSVAEAISNARGLYRVSDATQSLLNGGGTLAVKDGAKLGAIFKDGKLVAQARFIPVTASAAATLAAIGPAVAMVALQMQLGEISGLVRTNIALTTETLKTIRYAQWAELEGLTDAVNAAFVEAQELDSVTDTIWEPVAGNGPLIDKQKRQYRSSVAKHVQALQGLEGSARRQYLESNAEAIVFDTYALLKSLNSYAQYQALRAALSRERGEKDETEQQLFERITRTTPNEIRESLDEIRPLVGSLVRELRIIAELPGRASLPLSTKRRDAQTAELTCAKLLKAIEPLANQLQLSTPQLAEPKIVCAPEGLDLDNYLHILRWFLEDGEQLAAVAFPYIPGSSNPAWLIPGVLASAIDTSWNSLTPGMFGSAIEKIDSSTFVAVTDCRILSATPKSLLSLGELKPAIPLSEVKYVRSRKDQRRAVRPTISIITEHGDVQWMFPASADLSQIDALTGILKHAVASDQEHVSLLEQDFGESASD